jgi:hypothetical protein
MRSIALPLWRSALLTVFLLKLCTYFNASRFHLRMPIPGPLLSLVVTTLISYLASLDKQLKASTRSGHGPRPRAHSPHRVALLRAGAGHGAAGTTIADPAIPQQLRLAHVSCAPSRCRSKAAAARASMAPHAGEPHRAGGHHRHHQRGEALRRQARPARACALWPGPLRRGSALRWTRQPRSLRWAYPGSWAGCFARCGRLPRRLLPV